MSSLLTIKLLLPLAAIVVAMVLLMHCDWGGSPPQLNQRQAAMVESLRTAAPSQKEIR